MFLITKMIVPIVVLFCIGCVSLPVKAQVASTDSTATQTSGTQTAGDSGIVVGTVNYTGGNMAAVFAGLGSIGIAVIACFAKWQKYKKIVDILVDYNFDNGIDRSEMDRCKIRGAALAQNVENELNKSVKRVRARRRRI